MTYPFESIMSNAAQLMRSGKLQEATAALRAALAATTGMRMPPVDRVEPNGRVFGRTRRAQAVDPTPADAFVAVPGSFTQGSFRNKFGARDYKLYVPPTRADQGAPLLVMLHGCTQDPDDFARGTAMNELACEQGCLVLYPAQTQGANTSRCWNWFKRNHQRRESGEPGVLAGMVQDIATRYQVDRRRIYVAGLSAGGAMAAILGETYPDVFAAVGVHSGLAAGTATDVGSALAAMNTGAAAAPQEHRGTAVPTIVFHGDADTTVHPSNGERVMAAAGATGVPERVRERAGQGREATRHVYRTADGRVYAEHWVVHGSGHAWSGGRAGGSYTDPRGPDASAQMLRFFLAHPQCARP